MYKFMILTDSDGYPRSFPVSEKFELEETYPYLIRKKFNDSIFFQLSFADIPTMKLISQPLGFLTHWKPDIIIVQSGIADCRPEAFTDFQKEIINKVSAKYFANLKKYVNRPSLIKKRQLYRVTKKQFQRAVKKFNLIFSHSKIFWLEISVGSKYEVFRPGIEGRKSEYNEIIKNVYGEDFVPIQEKLLEINGFNSLDHGHQNKRGHRAVADILIEKIKLHLNKIKKDVE